MLGTGIHDVLLELQRKQDGGDSGQRKSGRVDDVIYMKGRGRQQPEQATLVLIQQERGLVNRFNHRSCREKEEIVKNVGSVSNKSRTVADDAVGASRW